MAQQTRRVHGAGTSQSQSRDKGRRKPPVTAGNPPGSPQPIGPYSHLAVANGFVFVSGTAGIDPRTNRLAGPSLAAQAHQIFDNLERFLSAAGSDLRHIVHVTIFLKSVRDFKAMNAIYQRRMGSHRPARTVVEVSNLPKPGARLTLNAIAVSGRLRPRQR